MKGYLVVDEGLDILEEILGFRSTRDHRSHEGIGGIAT